jgi:hypothetical protein
MCGAGQKAVGGGFVRAGDVENLDTKPTSGDDGWSIFVFNLDDTSSSGSVHVGCLG